MNEQILSQLERLGKLKEQGVITPEEFDQQKAALLNTNQAPVVHPVVSPVPAPKSQVLNADKKGTSIWKIVGYSFLGIVALGIIGNLTDKKTSTSYTPVESSMAADSIAAAVPVTTPSAPAEKWYYFDDTDKMGSKYYVATIDANETLDFDFPYNGGSTATLTIRKKGGSTDAYLKVSKGQFMINSVDGGSARIRFDNAKPITYSLSGAADYSSDMVFFDGARGLINRLKKAKKIVIAVGFYNEGERQIEFDTKGFKWNH